MADLSIFQGLLRPPKSVDDYDQAAATTQGLRLQNTARDIGNQTATLNNQTAQRGVERANQLLMLSKNMPQGASDLDRLATLRNAGFYDEADKLDTSIQNRVKTTAIASKDNADAASTIQKTQEAKKAALLRAVPTFNSSDDVKQFLANGVAGGHITMEDAHQMISRVPDSAANMQGFKDWQLGTLRSLMAPDKQMEYVAPNANTVANNQTSISTNAATNARVAQEGAANRGVTMRGQNMTDARTRESTSATMTKPFEVTGPDGVPMLVQQDKQGNISPVQGFGPKAGASKPLNDSQAKALGFGTRMQEADKLLNGLEAKGVSTPSMAKMTVGDTPFLGPLANAMSSPDEQSVDQAQRDFVNSILRRESGAAISNSEFDNARRQYFSQPGDSQQVKTQKAANRKLAMQGVLAEVPVGQRNTIGPNAPGASAAPAAAAATAPTGFKIIGVK